MKNKLFHTSSQEFHNQKELKQWMEKNPEDITMKHLFLYRKLAKNSTESNFFNNISAKFPIGEKGKNYEKLLLGTREKIEEKIEENKTDRLLELQESNKKALKLREEFKAAFEKTIRPILNKENIRLTFTGDEYKKNKRILKEVLRIYKSLRKKYSHLELIT